MAERRSTRQASKAAVNYEELPDMHLPARATKKKHGGRLSNEVYPIEITETDYTNKRVKVHYIGYPKSMDEWRDVSKDEERICQLDERLLPSEFSLEERTKIFFDRLRRKIKYQLFPSKQEDPNVKIEIEVDVDVFEILSNLGSEIKKGHFKVVANEQLDSVLGADWDHRIINKQVDFSYVIPKTVELWMRKRKQFVEFKLIAGVPIQKNIQQDPVLVFDFVRGDGVKAEYMDDSWRQPKD